MTKHEEALREIEERWDNDIITPQECICKLVTCDGHSLACLKAANLRYLREAFTLGWNAGARAQREADVDSFRDDGHLRSAQTLESMPLVTLDDAEERE